MYEDPIKLFKRLGIEKNDKILEIGCAIGYHTFPLAKIASDGKIFAVDIWEEGLIYLRDKIREGKYKNIEIICCSAEDVQLPLSSLDKIVCFDTLHEVSNVELVVKKWTEFLKEGGKLFYRDPKIYFKRIQTLSQGKFSHVETINGVHIFLRR
jgi:ubiquinone/menaquinone biosynthesis C-methylase UbiE